MIPEDTVFHDGGTMARQVASSTGKLDNRT
jgi:hypothetical protein